MPGIQPQIGDIDLLDALFAEEFLDGQPQVQMVAGLVFFESEAGGSHPGHFVVSLFHGAEMQVPKPSRQHAVLVIDKQRIIGPVADDLVELMGAMHAAR